MIFEWIFSEELSLKLTKKSILDFSNFEVVIPPFGGAYSGEELISHHLRNCILGLECYVASAIRMISISKDSFNSFSWDKFDNPHSFGGRGNADVYFRKMPSAVDKSLSLDSYDEDLYETVKVFYKEVRNPLFHGKEIQSVDISEVRNCFLLIAKIYDWIDEIYPLEHLWTGSSKVGNLYKKFS